MVTMIENPWRKTGLDLDAPYPLLDASGVASLLKQCPAHKPTPLQHMLGLAAHLGVSDIFFKNESGRMGLGSFKALGAVHAIAREAAKKSFGAVSSDSLTGEVYVTASAGNHGLSVATGARLFGAKAIIYLAETVPLAFEQRLREKGADVVRAGAHYEASMEAAEKAAQEHGWSLLSDSSWPGYFEPPLRVMEGYLQLSAEVVGAMDRPPTHIFLQAGVGGLATAMATYFRDQWGDDPLIFVVEPEAAPALMESIRAGKSVITEGPVSDMGRLDCKTPSLIALKGLARDADYFITVSESEAADGVEQLKGYDVQTTPSGGAAIAAFLCGRKADLHLNADARVFAIVSEGPEDG